MTQGTTTLQAEPELKGVLCFFRIDELLAQKVWRPPMLLDRAFQWPAPR